MSLQEKHPQTHPESDIPSGPSVSQVAPVQVSVDELARAIFSFPCGSSGGPDGLCPQHLKDMTGSSALGGGQMLLQSLTMFVNFVLRGERAVTAQASFFCTQLMKAFVAETSCN